MPQPPRDPLISGPERWRWPWSRARDVNIGSQTRTPSSSVEAAEPMRLPGLKPSTRPRFQHLYGETGKAAGWKVLLVRLAVGLAILYHLAPQLGRVTGTTTARSLLTFLGEQMPRVMDIDVGRWFSLGASGWFWQPFLAAAGAALMRLVAYNTARRDPLGAIWIAAAALAVDAATWIFVGLKLSGTAWSPAEGAALTTLLKVEGAVLLGLFFLMAATGKKKLGETDAHFNRG